MTVPARRRFAATLVAAILSTPSAAAQTVADDAHRSLSELTASLAIDTRWFPQEGLLVAQRAFYPGLVGESRLTGELPEGRHRWVASLFARVESHNTDRSHLDVREAAWTYDAIGWRLQGGVLQRTWGVAESNPLVDVVNQRDHRETPDLRAKLGQPGLAWAVESGNAGLELLALTLHRPRSFGAPAGRFHAPGIGSDPHYEEDAGPWRVDLAGRGTLRSGGLDLGVTAFRGNSREPVFGPEDPSRPHYRIRSQLGVDGQLLIGGWSFRTEAIRRIEDDTATSAFVVGAEHTIGDIAHTGADLMVIAEASWDERGRWTPTGLDRDLFLAARLNLNDAAGTDLLVAGVIDLEAGHQITRLEARRRWRDHWKFHTEVYLISRQRPTDAGYPVRRDSYVRVSAVRHF